VASSTVANQKDAVSGAEEQQVASPVEVIISFVLVQAPGTHLRVSVRKKEAAIAFIQEKASARGLLIGLIGKREDGLKGRAKREANRWSVSEYSCFSSRCNNRPKSRESRGRCSTGKESWSILCPAASGRSSHSGRA